MKKILSLILVVGGSAFAQQPAPNFVSDTFMNVPCIQVTNLAPVVNTAPIPFGAYITNQTGIVYTNKMGIQINTQSNGTQGLQIYSIVTNNLSYCTNDTTVFFNDNQLWSDRYGNLCTNLNVSVAFYNNATTTGSVALVLAPIYKGVGNTPNLSTSPGFGIGGGGNLPLNATWVDANAANYKTIYAPVVAAGTAGWSITSSPLVPTPGVAGYRLISATVTNAAGSIWLYDVSINGYK